MTEYIYAIISLFSASNMLLMWIIGELAKEQPSGEMK